MNENKEIENLLVRLSNVSRDMTKSVNYGNGSITKKQALEQERTVKKLSQKFELDFDYLMEKLNE